MEGRVKETTTKFKLLNLRLIVLVCGSQPTAIKRLCSCLNALKTSLGWVRCSGGVKALVRQYADKGVVDGSKVYIFGGSMGDTGTWNMLSSFPGLFSAAMPVAGNPSGLDAEKVAQTPLYTVMGTTDAIMDISTVETFLSEMEAYHASYHYDMEQGWTHEDVCKNSYLDERLAWVFAHAQGEIDDISAVEDAKDHVFSTVWYDLTGNILNGAP